MPRNVSNNKSIQKVFKENDIKNEHVKSEFAKPTTNFAMEETKKSDIQEMVGKMTSFEKEKALTLIKYRKARDNYAEYLKLVFPQYIWTPFHVFLAKVCQSAIQKIEKGEDVYICLSVPCQHGKSETVTKTLPSWFVGRNPDMRCIMMMILQVHLEMPIDKKQ